MTLYTKGPWRASPVSNFSGTIVSFIEADSGAQLAQTRGSDKEVSMVETQANANLMAAAPEMYEILKQVSKEAKRFNQTEIMKIITPIMYKLNFPS